MIATTGMARPVRAIDIDNAERSCGVKNLEDIYVQNPSDRSEPGQPGLLKE